MTRGLMPFEYLYKLTLVFKKTNFSYNWTKSEKKHGVALLCFFRSTADAITKVFVKSLLRFNARYFVQNLYATISYSKSSVFRICEVILRVR